MTDIKGLDILRFIYKNGTVSYETIKERFASDSLLDDLQRLCHEDILFIERNHHTNTLYPASRIWCTMNGRAYVENQRVFTKKFVLTNILTPIIVGAVASAITTVLTALLLLIR